MADASDEDTKKHQTVAEFKYSQALMEAVSSKMNTVMSETESKKFELGDAEKSVLMNINNVGLLQGAVAGMVALFSLRRVRSSLFARMVKQYEEQNPKNTASTTPLAGLSSPFRQQKNPLEVAGKSPIWVGLSWVTDLAASFMVAVAVSAAFTDQKKILKDVSEIPLVEGKSNVSRVFCPVIQETLVKMRQEASTPEEKAALSQPRTPYLAAWITFSQNCKLRQAHENLIRRQQGLGHDDVVRIPPPGVSKQHDRLETDDFSELDDSDGNDAPFDDFYDPRDEDNKLEFADTFNDSEEKKNDS